jgi:hypothetical protein
MSRPFWFTAFGASVLAGVLIHSWADTRTDATIIVSILVWALFFLGVVDVIRTTPPGPPPRNP